MTHTRSRELFSEALRYIPGGVNSPVRAFRAVGGNPFFVNRARGAKIWDVDGNELIDYVGTWGPAILGHAHPKIISAIKSAAENGTSFGIPNPLEVKMAKLICEFFPSIQKVRMTSSGTEACMTAIRLARGFTKPDVPGFGIAVSSKKREGWPVAGTCLIRCPKMPRRRTMSVISV